MGMMLRRHNENRGKGVTTLTAVTPNPVKENKVIVNEKPEEKPVEKKVTRADIMKMNVAQVRAYAETQGIEGANAISGAELKRQLVDKMFEDEEA